MPPVTEHSPTHEEVVKLRELLTILVLLAITAIFYALARASLSA